MKAETAQNVKHAKQKSKMQVIPLVALAVANVLVLSLDYRVIDAVYKMTKSTPLSVFAVFTTGLMFILWFDVLFRYLLANVLQWYISIAGSTVALITAGVFAFLDYGVSVDLGNGRIIEPQANGLFVGMVVLTVIHGALLFWWYIIDDQVVRQQTAAKKQAESDFDLQNVDIANTILERAGVMLEKRQQLDAKYGADAVSQILNSLAGLEDLLGVDINGDGKIGVPTQVQFASTVQAPPELANPTTANTQTPRP